MSWLPPLQARRFSQVAMISTALAMILPATAAFSEEDCSEALVPQPADCARQNADIVVTMPVGENTERIVLSPGSEFQTEGFSISIDGATVAGATAPSAPNREADIAASRVDIDVRFDGLDQRTLLNVSTTDLRAGYRAGERIRFRTSSNYPAWIARAELRILDRDAVGRPAVTVLQAQPNGEVVWAMPEDGSGNLSYVLRVYDEDGRFDETAPLELQRNAKVFATHGTTGDVVAAGEGEDRTRIKNIRVRGGKITVAGTGMTPGTTANLMGEAIPVDNSGAFVASRILPAGDHVVTVDADGRRIVRDVEIPRSEWFYVGIADLTFGKRLRDEQTEADPDFEETYAEGRLAAYFKGQTQRGYTITGSIDTGEGPLEDAFRRLNDKDPRQVLLRLDPEDLYQTYGDDSSAYDDAPTSGRFFLRVERDASSLTWGDFKADISGAEYLQNTRSLYGAELRYYTPSVSENGDPRASVTLYAAQPDSLPQRDILRGTGGSVYFLTRQDINGGSETITVETVDPDTGRVVGRRTLTEGVDYRIDYIQGVLTLNEPLRSSALDGSLISSGASGAYDVNLVAQYEYTPTMGSLEGVSFGGRVEVWATDQLRFGVTAMSETTGTADQRMSGMDVRYELGELSYIEAEVAQTEGPGFGRSISTDGGLTINAEGVKTGPRASAYRFDSYFDLTDLGAGFPGHFALYYDRKQAGFSTLTEDITEDRVLFGFESEVELNERLTFGIEAEKFEQDAGDRKTSGEIRLAYALSETWTVTAGLGMLDKYVLGDPSETGRRTDAAVRVDYQPSDDLLVYAFGQLTVDRDGGLDENNRIGVGIESQLTGKLRFSGEISDGDKGRGAEVWLAYAPTADNEVYLGYTIDPTRTGAGFELSDAQDDGTLVVGGRYRRSETMSTYAEDTWDLWGDRRSLTRAYGVTYTPDARWTFSGGVESGRVRDKIEGDFDRDAISLGLAYASSDNEAGRVRLEYRTEDGLGTEQDRETWALSAGYEYKLNDNWRFLANLDSLYSDSAESDFRNGEYVEASLGYAYRPVLNDRLNLLFRYTYLRDLPGEDQVSADGSTDGPLQVSNVFSIDGNYDLSPKLTIGAKYGYRSSRVADRGTNDFFDSDAHLGVLRFDWHVVHKWDVLAESRVLFSEQSNVTDTGFLLALYRHIGNNAKIGLGYEWGKVSDDMTDLSYVGNGIFLNLIGKF